MKVLRFLLALPVLVPLFLVLALAWTTILVVNEVYDPIVEWAQWEA